MTTFAPTPFPRLKLIGHAASRVMRNVWMLEELRLAVGLQFEHDPVMFNDPVLYQPPYSTFNPNAKVPVLLADGVPIFESLAINLYLAEAVPTQLSPQNAVERGQATQWALWAMTELELPVFDWALNTYLNYGPNPAPKDAAKAEAAVKALSRPLAALAQHLAKQPYLLGQQFTVADLNTACVMYRAYRHFDFAPYPGVADWMERCWSREAAKVPRRARGEAV